KDSTFIISLLYYLGILTLNGETEIGELRFCIPNLVVRKLYVQRIFEMFLPIDSERAEIRQFAKHFYQTGDLQPVCDFMEQRYFKVFDNRDYVLADELMIKTAFLTVLFDDVFYIMDSETEFERRYADLTMIVRPERRQTPLNSFVIEFKYLKLSDVKLSGEQVRQLTVSELKALAVVKQKLTESENQLRDYQTRLKSKYGDVLQLQLISVVAVGFERVVWQKV
ncbi:MAG: AAA family ATPase, partial [Candidatus Parabeggiatoa sp. nov. 1]